MAFDFHVTIGSSSPHTLADWWAEVLGWQVEPQDEAFIRRMIQVGAAAEAETTEHRGTLVWKAGAGLQSSDPGRPGVLFQLVPDAKTVKNRVHLDVRVGAERQAAEVARDCWPWARQNSAAAHRRPTAGSPWPTRRATSSA